MPDEDPQQKHATMSAATKEELEVEKLLDERDKIRTEREKLTLEIAELRRPWWKRSNYLHALLPLSIVIISSVSALIVSWSNGFFDGERAELESEKAVLQKDILEARTQREELQKQITMLQQETRELHNAAKAIVDLPETAPGASHSALKSDLVSKCERLLTQIDLVSVNTPPVAKP